jgi:hypothetical protein
MATLVEARIFTTTGKTRWWVMLIDRSLECPPSARSNGDELQKIMDDTIWDQIEGKQQRPKTTKMDGGW